MRVSSVLGRWRVAELMPLHLPCCVDHSLARIQSLALACRVQHTGSRPRSDGSQERVHGERGVRAREEQRAGREQSGEKMRQIPSDGSHASDTAYHCGTALQPSARRVGASNAPFESA